MEIREDSVCHMLMDGNHMKKSKSPAVLISREALGEREIVESTGKKYKHFGFYFQLHKLKYNKWIKKKRGNNNINTWWNVYIFAREKKSSKCPMGKRITTLKMKNRKKNCNTKYEQEWEEITSSQVTTIAPRHFHRYFVYIYMYIFLYDSTTSRPELKMPG